MLNMLQDPLRLLRVLVTIAYVMFMFASGKFISSTQYMVVDALAFFVLINLGMTQNNMVAYLAAIMVAVNYMRRLPTSDAQWKSYDGFASAVLLSSLN